MRCAICSEKIDTEARDSVRLSNTQPPWKARHYKYGLAASITALGDGFSSVIRAAIGEPEETYWFHLKCWQHFKSLLGS